MAPDSLVCESATVIGHVTIGSKTIVHPKARIIAKDGPIVIGEGNLIEENCSIINRCGLYDLCVWLLLLVVMLVCGTFN